MLAIPMDTLPTIKLVGYVSYKTPWRHFRRNVNEYILYFMKSGEMHIQENGVQYILKKGDSFMLEPNLEHEGTAKHACDYYYIHFTHPEIQSVEVEDLHTLARRILLEEGGGGTPIEPSICYLPKYVRFATSSRLQHFYHVLSEMVQLYHGRSYNRTLTAMRLSELCIEISREYLMTELQSNHQKNTKSLIKLNALLDFIHLNYARKISGADIEQEFACNFDYMNRVFSQVTGHTITKYINQVRINHAKELLDATHLSIGEVGYLVGLEDPYYFSKVFKKYVGMSPSEYKGDLI
ncbi:AraC family transcriptional regulator [Paenibacillus terrigena]|uniref:AraC family transcriptional regulator n=1 Tax=Paenibacillus terrigena TaxID=369333 RepID=UPI000379E5CD|nr:AraC family transcriptional regulator [Paenibacillus terrigena]